MDLIGGDVSFLPHALAPGAAGGARRVAGRGRRGRRRRRRRGGGGGGEAARRAAAVDTLAARVHTYTRDVVDAAVGAGVRLVGVQIGNEVRNGMLWPTGRLVHVPDEVCRAVAGSGGSDGDSDGRVEGPSPKEAADGGAAALDAFATYLAAGVAGVRASSAARSTPLILHTDRGDCLPVAQSVLRPLGARGALAPFAILGFSYHPKHHPGGWRTWRPPSPPSPPPMPWTWRLWRCVSPTRGGSGSPPRGGGAGPCPRRGKPPLCGMWWRPWRPSAGGGGGGGGGDGPDGGGGRDGGRGGGGKGVGVFWWQPEAVDGCGMGAVWEGGRYSLFDRAGRALPAAAALGEAPRGGRGGGGGDPACRVCPCGANLHAGGDAP
ncbi:hypothetical protein BU14_0167s0007 [Porphyra umbilicalis]|uniref:arabinogalactan endo-beta-1,4-galactanase n=1 Tax=Porphyra umbilicalis TaxID=2786 RepID=A0A1X6P7R4_PORUM|nr:hypothetical protein BU14_0167s0007 [Porphyra umbilicalis]|eukprot:OSX76932.1 hypothetical protein BU14_0167s0007 [Porphyra umbilicalis]